VNKPESDGSKTKIVCNKINKLMYKTIWDMHESPLFQSKSFGKNYLRDYTDSDEVKNTENYEKGVVLNG
jgi:hypothetical protein